MHFNDIIDFWFHKTKPEQRFQKNADFDATIKNRFSFIHHQASQGELFLWREHPEGILAEIIILDQFSRNLFRDQAQAFQYDGIALFLAQTAVQKGFNKQLDSKDKKAFLYMPFMHSESKLIHEEAEKLFGEKGLENYYKYELLHKNIIDEFGRYPHRNQILGRTSTQEEIEFLKQPNSSF